MRVVVAVGGGVGGGGGGVSRSMRNGQFSILVSRVFYRCRVAAATACRWVTRLREGALFKMSQSIMYVEMEVVTIMISVLSYKLY